MDSEKFSVDYADHCHYVAIAARLLYFGLKDPKRLAYNKEYKGLYDEYQQSPIIKDYLEILAKSMELSKPTLTPGNIFLYPLKNSLFSYRISDIPNFGKEQNKVLFPMLVLAIASYFFGDSSMSFIEERRNISLTADDLYDYIEGIIATVTTPEGQEIIKESDLEVVFQSFSKVQKISEQKNSNMVYLITVTLKFLKEQKMIIDDGGKYYASQRFRSQIGEIMNDKALNQILKLSLLSQENGSSNQANLEKKEVNSKDKTNKEGK